MEGSLGGAPPGWSYCLLVHRLLMYARRRERQPVLLPLSQVCFKIGRLQRGKFAVAHWRQALLVAVWVRACCWQL